jgi:hypothetical protein
MYYKYYHFIYNWSKFKKVDFSESDNDFYFGTEVVMIYFIFGEYCFNGPEKSLAYILYPSTFELINLVRKLSLVPYMAF